MLWLGAGAEPPPDDGALGAEPPPDGAAGAAGVQPANTARHMRMLRVNAMIFFIF